MFSGVDDGGADIEDSHCTAVDHHHSHCTADHRHHHRSNSLVEVVDTEVVVDSKVAEVVHRNKVPVDGGHYVHDDGDVCPCDALT